MPDQSSGTIETDIAIVGAGPAGCASALALKHSALRVLLLDKSEFPREKTCGDSVPAATLLNLENIDPGVYDRFLTTVPHNSFVSSALVFPSGKRLTVNWSLPGHLVYRRDFDSFLLDRVKTRTTCKVLTGLRVTGYERVGQLFHIETSSSVSDGPKVVCSRIIGADGAPSLAARELAGYAPDPDSCGQAVRCYYELVAGMETQCPLVFTHPKFFPGYFWLFPMVDGRINTGFGMPETWRKRDGATLHELFDRFIDEHPVVNKILCGSTRVTPIKGGMVPFAINWRPCSGPGFFLAGDAASLVNPLSGDGIYYAVKSGILAGGQAEKDLVDPTRDYPGHGSEYDRLIRQFLWNRMRRDRRLISLLTAAPVLLKITETCAGYEWFRNSIRKWI